MTTLTFIVPGPPVPKARPRVVRGHTYTPKRTLDYERKVRAECPTHLGWPMDARYALSVDFHVPTERRTDCDNLIKSVMDSLNGCAWNDDSQVDQIVAVRQLDRENPRAEIMITVLGEVKS